jgi:hypothetical protein
MLRDMALTPIVDRALISNDYAYRWLDFASVYIYYISGSIDIGSW